MIGRIDVAMYARAIPLLLRHLSILAVPLLAAVVDVLVDQVTPLLTDARRRRRRGPLYDARSARLSRGRSASPSFRPATSGAAGAVRSTKPGKRRAQSSAASLLAAIGFQFVVWAASYIGSFVAPALGLALGAVAAFFLIYTIPAAAIGGMPGSLAIGASIRGVRANVAASHFAGVRLLRGVVRARAATACRSCW